MASALELLLLAQAAAYPKPWAALTLQNSWTTPAGVQTLSYRLINSATVAVQGSIQPGTATAGTVVATLPAGYTPLTDQRFSGEQWDGTTVHPIMVRIVSAGTIAVYGAVSTSGAVLDIACLVALDA